MQSKDIIFGVHSIIEALKNPARSGSILYATAEAYKSIPTELKRDNTQLLSAHEVNTKAQALAKANNFEVDRVPGGLFLESDCLELKDPHWLYTQLGQRETFRIVALDQVTDVNNGAAILRTAAFYKADALCISQKSSFGLSPAFFRIASGAVEHVPIVICSNLSRSLKKLSESGVQVVGLAEESDIDVFSESSRPAKSCLVLGSEERGLSNAVRRSIDKTLAIPAAGQIRSLNVASAAAVSFQIFWGNDSSAS